MDATSATMRAPRPIRFIRRSVRLPGCSTRARLRLEPTLHQQRLDTRVAAAAIAVQDPDVARAAARQNHVAESPAVLARETAVLCEPRIRVVVEHFGPQIREIACVVS